jgi:hypothetical protein
MYAELTLGRGLVVSHGTVELLMHRAHIQDVTGRPRWRRTRPDLIARDLVDRQASGPDRTGNFMIEAFWLRMQVELLDRQSWRTSIELANAIFEYLEIWHDRCLSAQRSDPNPRLAGLREMRQR